MGAMTKRAKLLWMDLEMTGLSPEHDRIMEVAVIATDWNFNEIDSYRAVQKVDPVVIKERMVGDFWDSYPEVRKQLIDQNDGAQNSNEVEDGLIDFIDRHFSPDRPVLLAGNSIHQDRKFIDSEWVRLSERLHYRMLDVSAWKVVFEGRYKKRFSKPESHRAMEDIRGSIEELGYYLGKVKV